MIGNHGRVITASTDGACSGNPGPGGWGALLRFENGEIEEIGGHEANTTNNRMELKAAIMTFNKLKDLPRHPDLTVRTDSKYVINGLNTWIKNWKLNNWRTASGKPVLNKDLWQELDSVHIQTVPLEYVKGHSGDPDNERVDQIAVSFSKQAFIKLTSLKSTDSKSQLDLDHIQSSENSSINLNKLLTRLQLADKFANKGYELTLNELAELLNVPLEDIRERQSSWKWRNWIIEPSDNQLWKLRSVLNSDSAPTKN